MEPPGESEVCDPGRVTLRRLNRTHYDNTVRDLLGDESRPARSFPDDDIGHGFDSLGDVLSVSPLHIERYEASAQSLVEATLRRPVPREAMRYEAEVVGADVGAAFRDLGWNLWSNGEMSFEVFVRDEADYIIDVGAFGQQAGPDPVSMALLVDRNEVQRFDVEGTFIAPGIYSHRLRLEPGGHRIGVAFLNDYYAPDAPDPQDRDRNLIVDYVEVDGPIDPAFDPARRAQVMGCEPAGPDDLDCAREVVTTFARRAWRRPLEAEEAERLMSLVQLAIDEGDDVEVGIQLALRATLLSPHFIYRVELDADPTSAEPHRLSDHELATRLAYFIWSSTPDEALLAAADAGALQDAAKLSEQIARMLDDPKAKALVEDFGDQWLHTRAMLDVAPDYNYFPDFDDALRASMITEARLYLGEFFEGNQDLRELMRGQFTYLDERLASHYGLPAPEGGAFRRVDLEGSARGGLLTLGSVLTVTSFPTRTSPVKRGKWVLEQLLCTPPPAPPPGVEAELGEVDSQASLRERLAQHRQDPTCAACHDAMDPIGLGMESFDGIGAYTPVDSSGELPDGQRFDGAVELAGILAEDERLTDCASEKLFIHALGRGPEPSDHCGLTQLREAWGDEGYGARDLVHLMAASRAFTHRRGEPKEEEE